MTQYWSAGRREEAHAIIPLNDGHPIRGGQVSCSQAIRLGPPLPPTLSLFHKQCREVDIVITTAMLPRAVLTPPLPPASPVQMRLFHKQCREVDIVITTAMLPGKPAPKLITKEMVDDMKQGECICRWGGGGGEGGAA